jgi:dTDP-4-dehydrorhamnose reductase
VAKPGRRDQTILVTGATGQIGFEAVRELAPLGNVVGLTRADLDLAKTAAIRETVRRLRPRVIVNAGAYTAVDRAESERELCAAINADAPAVLADEARRLGALLVHYSTDYVFDGSKHSPYLETDLPAPLSVYGATKLAGEQAIQAAGGAHVILRTSWVYGARGTNFLRTMLRLARERTELRVVNDQVGAPTWSRSIAILTADIVGYELGRGEELGAGLAGLYHLAAAGSTTWYEFARCILEGDPQREEQTCRAVFPISTAEYRTAAQRPAYSVLDCTAFVARFRLSIMDWREQLALVLAELRQGSAANGHTRRQPGEGG